jgi:hypothetical protein
MAAMSPCLFLKKVPCAMFDFRKNIPDIRCGTKKNIRKKKKNT